MSYRLLKTGIFLSLLCSSVYSQDWITPIDTWRYYDKKRTVQEAWHLPSYDDSAWPLGESPLGYGEGDERTQLNKHGLTTPHYFRKQFIVKDLTDISQFKLSYLIDDGAIFYLNGKEVLRVNLPTNYR